MNVYSHIKAHITNNVDIDGTILYHFSTQRSKFAREQWGVRTGVSFCDIWARALSSGSTT